MNIEKITFYKQATTPNRSHVNSLGHCLVEISLPRVRFLETDGPYRPEWAVDYTPQPESIPQVEKVAAPEPPRFRAARHPERMRKMPLTDREKQAYELHQSGLKSMQIARRLGWTPGGTKDAIYRAKIKLGYLDPGNPKKKLTSVVGVG